MVGKAVPTITDNVHSHMWCTYKPKVQPILYRNQISPATLTRTILAWYYQHATDPYKQLCNKPVHTTTPTSTLVNLLPQCTTVTSTTQATLGQLAVYIPLAIHKHDKPFNDRYLSAAYLRHKQWESSISPHACAVQLTCTCCATADGCTSMMAKKLKQPFHPPLPSHSMMYCVVT